MDANMKSDLQEVARLVKPSDFLDACTSALYLV